MRETQSNVRLFQIFAFLNRLELWDAVYVLFLLDRGFSLAQYGILDSLWYVGTLLFEVPTGALTDRYGTRISLFLSVLSQSLAFFIMASGRSFLAMSIAFALWGFASSFETGTYSAFLYDSLKEVNRERDYRRVISRTTTLQIVASALGGAVAGYLGGISKALPIQATAVIALFLCPLVLFLKEPQVLEVGEPSYRLHIRESIRFVSLRRLVVLLLLYSAVMGAVVWGLRIFYQPLLDFYQIPVQGIGLLYLFLKLCAAAGAHFSAPLYRMLGRVTIYLIPLVLVVAVFGMGFFITPWVVGFIFVPFFIEGFYQPILSALLNENIPSGKRATIISLGSVVSCLISTAVNPVLGRIGDVVSLQMAFRVVGIGTFACMALLLAFLGREAMGST
jgi:MFS family permease